MSQTLVTNSLLEKIAAYLGVSSVVAKQALDEVTRHRLAGQKAAALATPLLAHMLKLEVLQPGHSKQATEMLGSHAGTLELLKTAVDQLAEVRQAQAQATVKTAHDLGGPVEHPASSHTNNPSGSYDSLTDMYVGQRTDQVKESDRKLLALIGR